MLTKYISAVFALAFIACQHTSDKIEFCDILGAKSEAVFFNKKTRSLVINDTFFTGSFDCKPGFQFCFNSKTISLNIPEILQNDFKSPQSVISGGGLIVFKTDSSRNHLVMKIVSNDNVDEFISCDAIFEF